MGSTAKEVNKCQELMHQRKVIRRSLQLEAVMGRMRMRRNLWEILETMNLLIVQGHEAEGEVHMYPLPLSGLGLQQHSSYAYYICSSFPLLSLSTS